jgi:hypothetical protein
VRGPDRVRGMAARRRLDFSAHGLALTLKRLHQRRSRGLDVGDHAVGASDRVAGLHRVQQAVMLGIGGLARVRAERQLQADITVDMLVEGQDNGLGPWAACRSV